MEKIIIILLLIFSYQKPYAQQEFFVSGQILDSISNSPLEYSAIGIFNFKDELIIASTTDRNGYFEMTIFPGKYKLSVNFMGYKTFSKPIIVNKNNQFLGTFKLSPEQNILNSVEVKTKSQSFKIDKEVYSVTHKLKVAAANTDDVLDKIQGVTYDRYNNNIKVDGQTNVKILVDGLEKDEAYIRNLNPERLKKVEIIRDPAGKYALAGYTAIINIILKKNYTGVELNISNQSIFDSDADDKSHAFAMNNSSVGLSYTYNKINVYGRYNIFGNDFNFPSSTVYNFANGLKIVKQPNENKNNFLKNLLNDKLTFGMDYYINPRHTISLETGFRNIGFNKDDFSSDYLVKNYLQSSFQNSFTLQNDFKNESKSNYQSIFYIGKLSETKELNLDLSFSGYTNNRNDQYYQDDTKFRTQLSEDTQKSVKLNSEYNIDITEKSNLQLGYGFYHQRSSNYLKTKVNNQNDETDFDWQDTRHKAFAYYGYQFNQKWSLKLGLASELSQPKAFGQQTQYFIYQPYLDLKHNLSKTISLKLKYRTQSDYPSLSQANPNEVYIDDQNVFKGNSSLAPQVTHQLSMRTNFFGGVMFLEPYYHFSDNYIGQINILRNDGVIEHTYQNLGDYRHYGMKGSLAISLSKKIFWQTNFDLYHSSLKYNSLKNSFNDYKLESNLVYVDKSSGITSGFIYQRGMNKYITAQGYNKTNNDFLGFLLQKSILKKRLNIMVLYMLPINTGIDYLQEEYIKTPEYESITTYNINLLKNVFVVRLNYRFNKGKATRHIKKKIEEDTPKRDKKSIF